MNEFLNKEEVKEEQLSRCSDSCRNYATGTENSNQKYSEMYLLTFQMAKIQKLDNALFVGKAVGTQAISYVAESECKLVQALRRGSGDIYTSNYETGEGTEEFCSVIFELQVLT